MLASRGCKIIIATNIECEAEELNLIEATNNPNITTKYLDLSSFASIRQFVEDVKKTETKIDFLVNNAGVALIPEIVSKDKLNNVMQINYFGHFLLTHLLIDELKAAESAHVAFVASSSAYCNQADFHQINELPKENHQITSEEIFQYYTFSKLCVIIAVQEFGKHLNKKYGITVNAVDPGILNTNIVHNVLRNEAPRAWFFKILFHFLLTLYSTDVFQAAKNTTYVLTADDINNGDYYFQCKPIFKPHYAYNPEFCEEIWKRSQTIVELTPDEKLS
ncbi:retinol dehydrogenase 13-like isoform X2 [Harmonia axyridis]|nr:retinol dehydrogenase 13-like isoform X2 [Harmonia axyridis]XP_045475560.1 retinol dehydrogenase 13-like isoform X2 [Harmonia axyridis]XP_045475562.1 retinol dehydrogenase 13-like isoform X2 [Harmonia axyridis]XP_045475563.1 retinol dehydrogenase 13-like isoform X2 [Harmonia axyridis]